MWDERFEAIVRRRVPALAQGSPLRPDEELRALGMDSVATVALTVDIEETYRFTFAMQDLDAENFRTPAQIWGLVCERSEVTS